MKIVLIGGTGLIGSKLAALARSRGHEVLQASLSRASTACQEKVCNQRLQISSAADFAAYRFNHWRLGNTGSAFAR